MLADGWTQGEKRVIALWPIDATNYLQKDAAAYFLAMKESAKASGLDLFVNSAWRSHEKQTALYKQYQLDLTAYLKKQRPTKPSIVARPGFSNHESGVAVDINRAPGDNLATPEPDSPTDKWLNANAAQFGFKRTVPSEAWHWEFDPKLLNNGTV